MEMTMKRSEVFFKYRTFSHIGLNKLEGRKFTYFMDKNEALLESVLKDQDAFRRKMIEKRGKITEEFLEAEKVVIEKYAEKNENGEAIVNGNFTIPNEVYEEFKKAKEELYEQFGELGAAIKKYNETMDEYMNEDITITLHHIKEDNLPEKINNELRKLIREYIVE